MADRWTVQCDQVHDLVPELAMGVAPGDERAAALAHLIYCAECRERLEETTRLVDDLLLLAPEHEPPLGFETRLLAAMRQQRAPARPRRTARWVAVAAAAAVLVALGGSIVTRWAVSDDLRAADQYRQTLDVGNGSYLRAADLVGKSGDETGHVFAYQGKPSWVFMTVDDAPDGTYQVRLVTTHGDAVHIGECWVEDGRGSWGTSVAIPINELDRVEMSSRDGAAFTADFRS